MTASAPPSTGSRRAARLVAVLAAATLIPILSPASTPAQAALPANFTITGSGFGHGVGMSQYGARAMAVAGRTANQILATYYTGTTVAERSLGRIKVQIAPASGSVTFKGTGGTVTFGATTRNAAVDETVTLTPSAGQLVAKGPTVGQLTAGAIVFRPNVGGYIMVAGANAKNGYSRGQLEVTNIAGKANVVVNLGLARDYVYGIAEMPSSWEPAALQAQAIAARTYAANQTVKSNCNCNVYSSVYSQVYNGRDKEIEKGWGTNWVAAVNATASSVNMGTVVVDSAGQLVTTYYYSSSGGRTENNDDVWNGTPLPHLRSIADPWSVAPTANNPNRTWTVTVSQSSMAKAFGLPNVAKIQGAGGTTSGGAPRLVRATAANGTTKDLPVGSFRTKLGLKSTWVKLSGTGPVVPSVSTPFTQIVLSPDMTGNGFGEILAVDQTGELVRYGFGAGNKLAAPASLGKGWGRLKVYAPGDWNGDGKADVMAVDAGGRLWLYAGNGSGGVQPGKQIGQGWGGFTVIPAGDLTGDGRNDLLAIKDSTGELFLYANNGKGGFKYPYPKVGYGWQGFELHAAGDVTKDGRADILSIDPKGDLYLYAGKGNGTFFKKVQVGNGWNGYTLAAGADLNRNGLADIVGRDASGQLFFYAAKGGGFFATKARIGIGW